MARWSKNMVKGGQAITRKSRPGLKPRVPLGSNQMPGRPASTVPNKLKLKLREFQGVLQGGAGTHVSVFDTGA